VVPQPNPREAEYRLRQDSKNNFRREVQRISDFHIHPISPTGRLAPSSTRLLLRRHIHFIKEKRKGSASEKTALPFVASTRRRIGMLKEVGIQ
jgi:acetylglutamate synthase